MRAALKSISSLSVLCLAVAGIGCSDTTTSPLAVPDQGGASKAAAGLAEELPQNIIDAVNQEKPDGTIVAAFREEEKGKTVYEVEVEMADGNRWEVEVDPDGAVLEVERAETAAEEAGEKADSGKEDETSQQLDIPSP